MHGWISSKERWIRLYRKSGLREGKLPSLQRLFQEGCSSKGSSGRFPGSNVAQKRTKNSARTRGWETIGKLIPYGGKTRFEYIYQLLECRRKYVKRILRSFTLKVYRKVELIVEAVGSKWLLLVAISTRTSIILTWEIPEHIHVLRRITQTKTEPEKG